MIQRLSRLSRWRPYRRGVSAIEFALTLPVLAFFLLAVIEYGWYFWQLIAMTNCTRDALRIAVTETVDTSSAGPFDLPVATAETRVSDLLLAFNIDPANTGAGCRIEAVPNSAGPAGTWTITLRACLEYEPLTSTIVPTPETITAEMTMLLEDQD